MSHRSITAFISSGLASSIPLLADQREHVLHVFLLILSDASRRFTLTTNDGALNRQSRKNAVISNLDHIRSYYEALNSGDADLVASHFTDDAVHYYAPRAARGGGGSGRTRRWASR